MLEEGRIVGRGTPDEIKRNPDPRVHQFLNAKIVPKVNLLANQTNANIEAVAKKFGIPIKWWLLRQQQQ